MPIKTRGRPKKARPTPETLSRDRSIAPRLIAERQKRGWSQRDLASAADLSPGAVQAIEGGGRPHLDTIERLAEALGVDRAWLAWGDRTVVLEYRGRRR